MKFFKLLLLIVSVVAIVSCATKSQEKETQWYKGNLHTHSYWSDGDEFPEEIMHWYKSNGYQFVTLSDHNTLAEGEKWKKISKDTMYQNAFKRYLAKYGEEWVNYKIDSGQILVKLKTYNEYKSKFEEDEKFLIMQAEEISDKFEDKPIHLVGTNLETVIQPKGGNSVVEVLQNNIDAVYEQREETGTPMIPHINHPNYKYAISVEDLIEIKKDRFFEVYNGHQMVHNLGDSIHISTEEMWDQINMAYLNRNQDLMYGLATDDSHFYHQQGDNWSNAGRGWIVVKSDSLSASSLIHSMEKGDFYSSTGVSLKSLEFTNNTINIEAQEENGVTYTFSFIGVKKGQKNVEIFLTEKGNSASFKVTEDIQFVRCKITSSKAQNNPIENMPFEMAWTQPVQFQK